MTREEAITIIGNLEDKDMLFNPCDVQDAKTMAIKALEQEPKTGHWIEGDRTRWKCSNCEYGVLDWNNTPYCPNCGERMESEDKK